MKNKLKILYISAFDHPGAGNRVLVNWLQWLNRCDYELYVACPNRGWLRKELKSLNNKNVLNAAFFIPTRRLFLKAIINIFRLYVFIIWHRIDIVHCNSDQAYYMACAAARMARRPIVTHLRYHYSEMFYKWMFSKWRKPNSIILVSEAFRNEEIDKLSNTASGVPVEVIHNCIDVDQYICIDPDINRASKVIFYPAAVADRKRQHQLYQLDALLIDKGHDFELLAAGKENDKAYKRKCEDESIKYPNNNVEFLGHTDSVSKYYRSAFISVTLSNYETFGYSVLESMASGVPVVGYKVPAIKEVLGDAGLLVEQNDLTELAEIISELKNDTATWKNISINARARARANFAPEAICPALIDLYRKVIDQQ